jgi:glycolate oxidase
VNRRYGFGATMTWEKMARIKELIGLPFMVKGIATPEDARIAVDHGVDVIWVSNHGGRQLDHGLGTLDLLPEVVDAVAGRAEVIVDGGVQRAADVVKALCLGAAAVAVGKLQGWGAAAAGSGGIVRMLEILEDEMVSTMGLLGVTGVGQLGPEYLRRADPVIPAHEMSAWTNMPGGRIF